MMTLRLPAILLSVVGLLATGLVATAPVQAATACTIESFSPTRVTLGLTPDPQLSTFAVKTSGCQLTDWTLEGNPFYVFAASPQWPFQPLFNDEAGPRYVTIDAASANHVMQHKVFANGFSLLRRTEWQTGTFNASPEPVKKGKPISIKGRLRVVDWDVQRYVAYTHRTVSIQFKSPTGTYKTVKTATTSSTGWLDTTVTASATGTWRIAYWGNTVAGNAVSAGDTVPVTP
jgi:hypothetical protein